MGAAMQAVVADFRGVIVLLADEPAPEDRATLVAWLLFHDSQERLAALRDAAAAEESVRSTFLDRLESDPGLRDADKLAFRDVLADLPASARVAQDRGALDAIQARYDAEMKKLFGRLPTRGLVDRREAWEDYLTTIRGQVSRDALIAAHQAEIDALAAGARGTGGPWRDDKDQVTGHQFPEKSVLLTFDDGPSSKYTPVVLQILQRYGVRAVFFQIGRNIGKAEGETRNILAAGHALANHSFSHAFLPKLDADALNHQLVDTNEALEAAVKQKPLLFRPPYGARNDKILAAASGLGMKTILWNVDSQDWADPVPQSIASRVVAQVERQKHGIILFHDIHERTTQALPLVLDELQKRGYRFLSWDGRDFSAARGGPGVPAPVVAEVSAPQALSGQLGGHHRHQRLQELAPARLRGQRRARRAGHAGEEVRLRARSRDHAARR